MGKDLEISEGATKLKDNENQTEGSKWGDGMTLILFKNLLKTTKEEQFEERGWEENFVVLLCFSNIKQSSTYILREESVERVVKF